MIYFRLLSVWPETHGKSEADKQFSERPIAVNKVK